MNRIPAASPDNLEPATDWRASGACLTEDSDLFFPLGNTGIWLAVIEQAKAVCRRCPSIDPCLQWALETGEEHGVCGGLSEDERRAMKRRAARTISVDDYTGTPRTPATGRTLQQAWEACTQDDGEHLLWIGSKVVYRPHPLPQVTPNRLAFYLDRGRWPEGDVKRMCEVGGCVRPAHLADRAERAEEADLKVSA